MARLGGRRRLSEDIHDQALSDAGQDPSAAIVFLVAAEESHEELIQELRGRNARVYVMTPHGHAVQSNALRIMSTAAWGRMAMERRDWRWPPRGYIDEARETSMEVKRR